MRCGLERRQCQGKAGSIIHLFIHLAASFISIALYCQGSWDTQKHCSLVLWVLCLLVAATLTYLWPACPSGMPPKLTFPSKFAFSQSQSAMLTKFEGSFQTSLHEDLKLILPFSFSFLSSSPSHHSVILPRTWILLHSQHQECDLQPFTSVPYHMPSVQTHPWDCVV